MRGSAQQTGMEQYMADLQGVIFDLDGVIADTAEFHYLSWQRLADEEGIEFTREDNEQLRGVTREVSLQRFTAGIALDDATRQDWFERKNTYFHEYMHQLGKGDELPGIASLLDDIHAAGMRVGVGSASKNARPVLERLELVDRFEVIGDGYTVSRSKPNPDVFLWVAGALGISPKNTLVIEDSIAGVRGALDGGFYAVLVGDNTHDDAHICYDSLGGISLDDILKKLPMKP